MLKDSFSRKFSRQDGFRPDALLLQAERLEYSLRRYFVDEFHFRHVPDLLPGSRVLDLGGNKTRKRGQFDIERYDLRVVYANLSTAKLPDVQADAAHVPFRDGCFDAVFCSELLEHVPDPRSVLREVYRVLRKGGKLLICAPFLVRIHGDPDDYGRYTDFYWSQTLATIGCSDIRIEKQGLFWSVLMDMLRGLVYQMVNEEWPRSSWMHRLLIRLVDWGWHRALDWDARPEYRQSPFFSSFTTGFGIVAYKSGSATGRSE